MSLRLEMLQVARLAPKLLGESAELVRDFLMGQRHPDGGFVDREGKPDLYYTVFGLDGLLALSAPAPMDEVRQYLKSFGDGEGLDFVHLCCLARCWAAVGSATGLRPPALAQTLLARIERFRSRDGGYHPKRGNPHGSAYGAFLALGAYEDLECVVPQAARLGQSLEELATPDGAWTNERVGPRSTASGIAQPPATMAMGSTNATAAVVLVARHLLLSVKPGVGEWLRQRFHPQGGFQAGPNAPMPDLLSTATALHALAALETPIEELREGCLDFVDSLWTNAGAFHGNWTDHLVDAEYTFYGLLALGHLSL